MNSIDPLRFIVQLYASSVAAAEILSHFATRQRNRRTETVRRLKQVCGNGTTRQAVIAVLRQLESHGFGTFVTGRRGHESRFIWNEV
jgi:hypothetical protein